MASLQEKVLLVEFRELLKAQLSGGEIADYILIIYLRACDMDVKKAKDMFDRGLQLQKSIIGTDEFIDITNHQCSQELTQDFKYKFLGTDLEGRLVYWLPTGRWNVRKYVEKGMKVELYMFAMKYLNEHLRRLYEQGEKTGKHQTIVVIEDLDGWTFRKLAHVETVQLHLKLFTEFKFFSPFLHRNYTLNPPKFYSYLRTLVKPFVSKDTENKIVVLSSKNKEWVKTLLEHIPADILPVEYGGTGPAVLS